MAHGRTISIWFFIGVLLLIYGVLILGYRLTRDECADARRGARPSCTSDIWWGALLVVLGAFYTWTFLPGRKRD